MAIHNDPRLYTGGSERFNMMPHVQLYAQLAARKQARDDAFDEYMRNMNKNINSAGLRNVDREAFDNGLADFQKFGIENKDAIRSRKGGADMIYQQKYQDLQNLIAESKGEEQKLKPFVEMRLDPNKWERVDQEGVMKDIDAHNQPLRIKNPDGTFQRNPTRKSLDYNSFSFNPKEYTPEQLIKYDEALTKAIPADKTNIEIRPHPTDKYSQIEVTSSSLSPLKLAELGDRAKNDFASDKSLAYTFKKTHPFEKWVNDNGKEFNSLNKAFKAAYGQDANIQDEDDLFAATKIQSRLQPTINEKRIDNKAQEQRDRVALQNMRNANAKELLSLRHSLSENDVAANDLWIDNYVDAVVNEAKDKPKRIVNIKGQRIKEDNISLDPTLSAALSRSGQAPEFATVTADGKIRPLYIKYDKDGNPVKVDNEYVWDEVISVPITKEQTKLALGKRAAGVKQTNMEMQGHGTSATKSTKQTTTIKTSTPAKPKKVVQNGVEYTYNEATGQYE